MTFISTSVRLFHPRLIFISFILWRLLSYSFTLTLSLYDSYSVRIYLNIKLIQLYFSPCLFQATQTRYCVVGPAEWERHRVSNPQVVIKCLTRSGRCRALDGMHSRPTLVWIFNNKSNTF